MRTITKATISKTVSQKIIQAKTSQSLGSYRSESSSAVSDFIASAWIKKQEFKGTYILHTLASVIQSGHQGRYKVRDGTCTGAKRLCPEEKPGPPIAQRRRKALPVRDISSATRVVILF